MTKENSVIPTQPVFPAEAITDATNLANGINQRGPLSINLDQNAIRVHGMANLNAILNQFSEYTSQLAAQGIDPKTVTLEKFFDHFRSQVSPNTNYVTPIEG